MPHKPKRPCSFQGCPELTDGRYCPKHQKLMNADWYQIYSVVRDNYTVEYGSTAPHDDFMERLLSSQGK